MGHGERRRELERRFPGWEIWYVPRGPDGAAWRARPRMLINAEDPEDLAAAIRAAGNPVIPDSVLLASPRGDAARVRRLGGLEASAGAAWRRMKGPQNAPGAAAGFPAGGSAWPGLSTGLPSAARADGAAGPPWPASPS